MRLPKPQSLPGALLYGLAGLAFAAIARVVWVLVDQNVQSLSAERGYDRLLSRHWSEVVGWTSEHLFWLSLGSAFLLGGALCAWAYAALIGPPKPLNDFEDPNWEVRLKVVAHERFFNVEVPLDWHSYQHCKFSNVTFDYKGAPFKIEHCEINGAIVRPDHPMLQRLSTIYHSLGMMRVPYLDRHGVAKPLTPLAEGAMRNTPVEDGTQP